SSTRSGRLLTWTSPTTCAVTSTSADRSPPGGRRVRPFPDTFRGRAVHRGDDSTFVLCKARRRSGKGSGPRWRGSGGRGGRRADGHGTHPERYRSIRGGEEAVSAVRGHLLKDILPHGSTPGEENQDFFGLLWSEAR